MREFKIRCSQIGQIMKNDRSGKGIGKTVYSYLDLWAKSQIYNKHLEIKSKYLDKGNICEADSIEFIGEKLGLKLVKNTKQFENDFFTGMPDINDNEIIEAKNSWDWNTFPLFDKEPPNNDYVDQCQGYMNLTGKTKAKLIYILSDTPIELIEKEAGWKCRELGLLELDYDIVQEYVKKMTYPNIPDEYKFKIFEIERDENRINEIKERVLLCREIVKNQYTL